MKRMLFFALCLLVYKSALTADQQSTLLQGLKKILQDAQVELARIEKELSGKKEVPTTKKIVAPKEKPVMYGMGCSATSGCVNPNLNCCQSSQTGCCFCSGAKCAEECTSSKACTEGD